MIILDAGHKYKLDVLDGNAEVILTFVKREGDKFPGNIGHYSGTQIQEVCRVLIDRINYLNKQAPHEVNVICTVKLKEIIYWLEYRAHQTHGLPFDYQLDHVDKYPINQHGHIWEESK
jgi:hypothetical protein